MSRDRTETLPESVSMLPVCLLSDLNTPLTTWHRNIPHVSRIIKLKKINFFIFYLLIKYKTRCRNLKASRRFNLHPMLLWCKVANQRVPMECLRDHKYLTIMLNTGIMIKKLFDFVHHLIGYIFGYHIVSVLIFVIIG